MAKPQVLLLRAPGTNCDEETKFAFELAGAVAHAIHIHQWLENPKLSTKFQILCFPGGFSYGDDIAAGRILASQIHAHLGESVNEFCGKDRLVLGICNGFQILMRLGILFEGEPTKPPATLTWNVQGRFECRWVHLKAGNAECPFLKGIDRLYLPMAHAEGRIVFRDPTSANALAEGGQLAMRYSDANGETGDELLPFPMNPNGAERNVAGLCDRSGRIFGLMPHPERHLFPTHHPYWTRRSDQPQHGDGLAIFTNAVAYFG